MHHENGGHCVAVFVLNAVGECRIRVDSDDCRTAASEQRKFYMANDWFTAGCSQNTIPAVCQELTVEAVTGNG